MPRQSQPLDILFLRTAWIFQALAAAPIFVILGISTFINLFQTVFSMYDFVTDLCTTFLSAGIIFCVAVQQKLSSTPKILTLRFEIAKTVLATALWLWLLLDSIFGPADHYWNGGREQRIRVAAVAVIILFLLFFPTVAYSAWIFKGDTKENDDAEQTDATDPERQPFLES